MVTVAIDNKVKQVVSNIRNLPTPPIVFHQIQKVMSDPKVSADQIASILSEDPAMSVKVLKLTNSAFYGLAHEVESVRHAVVIVGLEAIKNLVLSASVLDMFKGEGINQEFQEGFWRHSLAVAVCARILAHNVKAHGLVSTDSAFSGGLLHDIGKMVLACFLREEHERFEEERLKDRESQTFEIEERVLGYNHAQIGSILATQWKLPQRLIEAITYHHHPQLSETGDPIAYIIHVANHIAKLVFYNSEERYLIGTLPTKLLDYMKITPADIETFKNTLREEYLKAETFMRMAGVR